jgi:hypothetical protein
VPYIMICTSNTQPCGMLSTYRENTSQQIIAVSATISQEKTCPTQVDTLSTVNNNFCIIFPPENRIQGRKPPQISRTTLANEQKNSGALNAAPLFSDHHDYDFLPLK